MCCDVIWCTDRAVVLSMARGMETRDSVQHALTFITARPHWFKEHFGVELRLPTALPPGILLTFRSWNLFVGIQGVSAGVVALLALLRCMAPTLRIIPRVACTGTVSLAGQIGFVDGGKAKIEVARAEGFHRCLVPRTVLEMLTEEERQELTAPRADGSKMVVIGVETVVDVLTHAMEGAQTLLPTHACIAHTSSYPLTHLMPPSVSCRFHCACMCRGSCHRYEAGDDGRAGGALGREQVLLDGR